MEADHSCAGVSWRSANNRASAVTSLFSGFLKEKSTDARSIR